MSYGNSLADAYHRVGIFTGKVLRGTKPADLPGLVLFFWGHSWRRCQQFRL
jgi:hypothetical protein